MFPSRIASVLGGVAVSYNNYSIDLDGTNDYVSVPVELDDNDGSSLWTLSGWFYLPADISVDGLWGYDNANTLYRSSTTEVTIYWGSALITSTITPDAWNYIVVTRNGSAWSLYVNAGTPATATSSNYDDGTTLILGGQGTGNTLQGRIAEVAIWDTALGSTKISELYEAKGTADLRGTTAVSKLKGWWKMGDGRLDSFPLIADQVNPTLGSELLAATGWGLESAWTLSGGVLTFDDTGNGRAELAAADMTNGTGLATGKTYKLQFTVGDLTSGTATMGIQDSGGTGELIAATTYANGSYTRYFAAPSSANGDGIEWVATTDSTSSFTISDYSLKQIQGNPGLMTNMASDDIVRDTP